MNMKRILFCLIFVSVAQAVYCQHIPVYSQYLSNLYLVNPSAANIDAQTSLCFHVRHQWTDLDYGAPETYNLTAGTRNNSSILAGSLCYDSWGNSSVTSARFTYGQDFKISGEKNTFLTFGISLSARQFSIDQSGYVYFDIDDPALTGLKENYMNNDVDFGALFHGEKFRFGASAMNLLNTGLVLGTNVSKNNYLQRQFFFHGSYILSMSEDLSIEPALLARISESFPLSFDVSSRLILFNQYYTGLSWRYSNAMYVYAGLNLSTFRFGYAYDMSFNRLSVLGRNTHELFFAYIIPLKKDTAYY
jgi:type IX secretion system PorP/SprF family membrane protein